MICRNALAATIRLLLAATLLAAAPYSLAQAEEQAAPELDVIELPSEEPKASRISVNWGCDVLLIEDSRRFRAGHCPSEKTEPDVTELEIETADESQASLPERRSKLMY